MKRWITALLLAACAFASPARADFLFTNGAGNTAFDFTCFSTKHCFTNVIINSAGTEIMTAANPGQVTGANGTFPATQSGNWTVRNVGNAGAIFDAATGAAVPANALYTGMNVGGNLTGLTGTANGLKVDGSAVTQPVSGTLTANQGGIWNVRVTGNAGAIFDGATAAAVPANVLYMGVNNGGNLLGWPAKTASSVSPSDVVPEVAVANAVAPITPADAASNPTTTSPVISFGELWNGSTWDRMPGSAALGVKVISPGTTYQEVAASSTATVLQTSAGATGDYLSHCIIYPATTSPGVVTVFDNTNTAANNAIQFPGGTSSTSNLVPFVIAVGAKSVNGAWKVTTGTNVAAVCVGKFS